MEVFGDLKRIFGALRLQAPADTLKFVSGLSEGLYGLSCMEAFLIYFVASITVLSDISVFKSVGSLPPCGDRIYSSIDAFLFYRGHWY